MGLGTLHWATGFRIREPDSVLQVAEGLYSGYLRPRSMAA